MSFKIDETNYDLYKKVFVVIWTHYSKLFPPEIADKANPIEILNQWEKKNRSIARRGLKEGLREIISSIKEFPADMVRDIDTDLRNSNLPTIQNLQGIIKDTIMKVLKREKIKNLDDFYIIKELVIDQTTELTDKERDLLDKYMAEFEFVQ